MESLAPMSEFNPVGVSEPLLTAVPLPGRASLSLASDYDDDLLSRVDVELCSDAGRRLDKAVLQMERFLRREDRQPCGSEDSTQALGHSLVHEARRMLRGALSGAPAGVKESTLRSAYRLTGMLKALAAWSAPASQESHAVNSFPVASARDVVAYSRYGCAEIAAQESAYLLMLGFDAASARLLLTSSGMTAYALIEAFLLREVLRPQDRVLVHPHVYFETQRQIRTLSSVNVRTARGNSRADVLADIEASAPKIVFVDPLSNSAELCAIDVLRLLDEAAQVCRRETWFVIDGTLLSGCTNAFARKRRNVRVLYYESGCKYLQFGMDLGPAGVVVVESDLAAQFEQLRRGIGAIAAESLIFPRSSRETYLRYLRAQTASANAVVHAVAALSPLAARVIEVTFPLQPDHADHEEAKHHPHLGGVLVFRFTDARLNRREPLETFIDSLIIHAREARLPLTAGVSFGFRIPRIGAAWSSYETTAAFLRLSAGVDVAVAASLGELIARCAPEFAAEASV